jgi:polyribonucleotide nucleotidyltransferase
VGAGENAPRIFLGCLERQGYPLAVQIHIQHLDGHFVTDGNNLGRVIDVLPRQLGNVNQAVDSAQVHEGTKVDDGGHHTLAHLALL